MSTFSLPADAEAHLPALGAVTQLLRPPWPLRHGVAPGLEGSTRLFLPAVEVAKHPIVTTALRPRRDSPGTCGKTEDGTTRGRQGHGADHHSLLFLAVLGIVAGTAMVSSTTVFATALVFALIFAAVLAVALEAAEFCQETRDGE